MLAIFHKAIHKSNHAQSMLALCWSLILLSWARNRLCRELLLCLLYFTKLFTRARNQCCLCVGLWFLSNESQTYCRGLVMVVVAFDKTIQQSNHAQQMLPILFWISALMSKKQNVEESCGGCCIEQNHSIEQSCLTNSANDVWFAFALIS